jgi:hypothetical protein
VRVPEESAQASLAKRCSPAPANAGGCGGKASRPSRLLCLAERSVSKMAPLGRGP